MNLAEMRFTAARMRRGTARCDKAYLIALLPLTVALWLLGDFTLSISPDPADDGAAFRDLVEGVEGSARSQARAMQPLVRGASLDDTRGANMSDALVQRGKPRLGAALRQPTGTGAGSPLRTTNR